MANLFKNLPHLLGTITNLDGAQSMRALASINAEIHRRERLFGEFEVNHINQYQKKFKNGEATEPLPHLFLISDEFAELKVNQPDFIKELVSIARVGRSLGVHLILATQKPSGVVDDQIWSNSRFKIALKVADRSDSNEMLHTPDAAEITQTGRAMEAAELMKITSHELLEMGIVDKVISETGLSSKELQACVKNELRAELDRLQGLALEQLLEERYQRFRKY